MCEEPVIRKLAVLLSGFALTVTVGACGEPGGNETATNGSGGGNQAMTAGLTELVQRIGESTAETNTAHFTMLIEAGDDKVEIEGDIKFGSDDVAMELAMSHPGLGDVSVVLVDGLMYVRTGKELEPGKPWLKVDPTADDTISKSLRGMVEEMSKNADPRATVETLKNAGTLTAEVEAELNGERTTRYTILADFEKMAAEQNDPELATALDTLGAKEFPVELWINGNGLPVRMKMEPPMTDPNTGKPVEAVIQADYTKWGEPVEIDAPPADQVTEPPS